MQFRKCLWRKFVFKKLKVVFDKRLEDSIDRKKVIRFRINDIKSIHREFFNRVYDLISFHRLIRYNDIFLKKKFYLKFFKIVCQIITNKCKERKKIKDIEELYKITLIQKTFNFWKKATAISIEERGYYYRKLLIKGLFFKNLKENYVIKNLLLVPSTRYI
jgi:hypothetical protein